MINSGFYFDCDDNLINDKEFQHYHVVVDHNEKVHLETCKSSQISGVDSRDGST